MRFSENPSPVRREIKESRDNDDVEPLGREWKSSTFASDESCWQAPRLRSQCLEHRECRLERDNFAPYSGKRQRHATGACPDIQNARTWLERRGCREAMNNLAGEDGTMPAKLFIASRQP